MPELIIIAGANGVGKTTFARPYTKELGYDFLNADDLTKDFEDKGEKAPLIKAGRVFFRTLNAFIENGESFVVETTMSGSYINKVTVKAKSKGYFIRVIYIFLESPEICKNRVRMRTKKGGHHVPDEDVERRFYRSLNNFWKNFSEMSDEWILNYNGENGFQEVAEGVRGEFEVLNDMLFAKFISIQLKNE